MIEVEIEMVRLDPDAKTPIVILREKEGKSRRILPIWIGLFEAIAIVTEIDQQTPIRPMTHDLLKSVIDNLGAEVISVLVSDLREDTFYAEINLRQSDGKVIKIDSRPSDAIALSLRAKAPIYVSEEVMAISGISQAIVDSTPEDHLKAILDNLKPEDFGDKV
ncbi:TPA: bifunctional nuclease family protein [Candidatus Poribacteria bacterium]|nr:bifunctional nuclease family protein [Candidatus Poribacteria bacterium]